MERRWPDPDDPRITYPMPASDDDKLAAGIESLTRWRADLAAGHCSEDLRGAVRSATYLWERRELFDRRQKKS